MNTGARKFARLVMLLLPAVFLMSTQLLAQSTPVDWAVGDVFVGTGNGSYEVWHSANPTASSPMYRILQSINDGTANGGTTNGGATAGCGFDSAYRFFGTNSANALVDRYAIDSGDNNHSIAQQLASNSGGTLPESVVFDGGKNLFIGYAGGATGGFGTIEQWTKDTSPLNVTFGKYVFAPNAFSVPVDNTGPGWIDLAADGHTIFYTSQGRKIYRFDSSLGVTANNPSVWADLSTLNGSNNFGTLYAVKILGPNYDGSNGVLVADQSNVKLIMASNGAITSVQTFKFKSNSNLQALALDAFNPLTTFWVGDASANNLFQFNMSTGKTSVVLNTGVGTTLGGVCVDGGLSGAELAARPMTTQTFSVTPTSNTISFTSPFTGAVFTATLPGLQNNVTETLRDSVVDSSFALSDSTVFSFNPGNPSFGLSTVPGNMVCDQTLTSAAGLPNACEVFELEANPNSGFLGTSVAINGPGNLPGTLPNPRLLRNLDEDITDDIDYSGTKSPGKCVYTINQQTSNPGFEICGGGFSSPAAGTTFSKNQASSIPFKFNVAPTGQCPSGKSPTNLQPLLMIVQIQPSPGTGPTPAPVDIPVTVAGNSGGPPTFVLTGNSWQLQVKTSNMQAGFTYVATMVDLAGTIPAISVTFSLN
ncbi:MAG: Bacterial Ig-like domain {group 1 [Acidobacteriaceae bacterium]|nr:Bacterial Ig-like domain {group 1 [Acidobacteriaceae bacterium]